NTAWAAGPAMIAARTTTTAARDGAGFIDTSRFPSSRAQYTLRRVSRSVAGALRLAVALLVSAPAVAGAHDIPASVVVQAYIRPEGQKLYLLVRVPLGSMRDVDFPVRPDGQLDIARAQTALTDAATLWLVRDIEMYEDTTRLPAPRVLAVQASLPSDRSFVTYDTALAHVTGRPLAPNTSLSWNQALLDV